MVNCPVCGREVDGKKFCPNCGSAVMEEEKPVDSQSKTETKYCSNCGAEIDIKAEICPKCGVRQSNINSQSSDKNVWVALVLSLLVVGLGHFYLGLPKKAIMLIVLTIVCWILIFFFIGIILYPLMLIYGVYDVYKSANAMANGEYVEDKLF
ncbi:MAG: zinc-ribbon domain-containing protein [Methanobrevibacter woesei]|uniref:zinc ribbon domain-containing protein n=1 Tax=Methanobrevibacter woesei TaxID=190976 RepID=UPI0023F08D48|nr:zinc-ribbon domain-containing protein [Methanobrevibacter woesei]MCI7290810.1 zinc-ribbon domain-containing protein [Methanobrevibacter woesei]